MDVVAALVTHADAVSVVWYAVGSDLPFRTSQLNASVTTDDVVVADAVKPSLLMPIVYILGR